MKHMLDFSYVNNSNFILKQPFELAAINSDTSETLLLTSAPFFKSSRIMSEYPSEHATISRESFELVMFSSSPF